MVLSPCISICRTDPVSGFCYGCGRTTKEKIIWKEKKTSDTWKEQNLLDIQNRLNGWQLESFRKSYKNKLENGVSIFKKEILK